MNESDAKKVLLFHALHGETSNALNCNEPIISSVRAKPRITENHIHEIMSALEVLSKNWVNEDSLDKSVVSAIWDIVFMVPERLNDSFHNHNAMLKDEYLKYIEWLDAIARAAMCLASGMSYSEASLEYRELFEDSDVEYTIGRLKT